MNLFRTGALALATTMLCAAGAHAAEPVLYQSAALVAFGADEPGDYYIDAGRGIGSAFQLTQAADVSAIGGYFSMYSDGAIFGAIVPLASLTSLPSAPVDANAIAHVVFTPDGSDQTVALSAHLAPGYYGVVFGSGLFGANGTSGLVSSQLSAGNTTFSGAGSSWTSWGDSDTRSVVYGVTAVPEPAPWAMLAAGLIACGGWAWRTRARAG